MTVRRTAGAAIKMRQALIYILNGSHLEYRRSSVLGERRSAASGKDIIKIIEKHVARKLRILLRIVSGYRKVLSQRSESSLCNIGVFNVQGSANAAAVAGVKLNEIKILDSSVIDLVKNVYTILDTVCRQILIGTKRRRFSARSCPVESNYSRLEQRKGLLHLLDP